MPNQRITPWMRTAASVFALAGMLVVGTPSEAHPIADEQARRANVGVHDASKIKRRAVLKSIHFRNYRDKKAHVLAANSNAHYVFFWHANTGARIFLRKTKSKWRPLNSINGSSPEDYCTDSRMLQ